MSSYSDPVREQSLERSLPNAAEAERAALGAVLLNPQALVSLLLALLRPEDFYVPSHRRIFVAMCALIERDVEITPISIAEELKKENALESVGGLSFITMLTNDGMMAPSMQRLAKIIRGKADLRALIRAANKITQEALEQESEPDVILAHAEREIIMLVSEAELGKEQKGRRTFAEIAESVNAEFSEWKEGKTRALRTFIPELDNELKLNGFARGDLIYVGAATSRGKTALVLQIARMQAMQGHKVLIFSLEMSAEALYMRTISSAGHVENWKIRPDMFQYPETVERVAAGFVKVKHLPIIVDHTTRTLSQIVAVARDEVRYNGVAEIVVDYTQLVDSELDRASRERQVAHVSTTLKGLARSLNVPIVATSALSRAANKEEQPDLDHMRESGQLEFDADVVLLPYGAKKRSDDDVVPMKLFCPKQRNGKSGWTIDVDFDKTYQTFMTAQMYADDTAYERTPKATKTAAKSKAVEPEQPPAPEATLAPEPPSEQVLDELDGIDFLDGQSEPAW